MSPGEHLQVEVEVPDVVVAHGEIGSVEAVLQLSPAVAGSPSGVGR